MIGLLLSDDLIFNSRVSATARAYGSTVTPVKTIAALLAKAQESPPVAAILDLQHSPFDLPELLTALKAIGSIRVVAYGAHVDAERLKAAKEAGCDIVLTRSKFVNKLETDLPAWLGQ